MRRFVLREILPDGLDRVQFGRFGRQRQQGKIRLTRAAADRLYDELVRQIDEGDLLRVHAVSAAGLERCRAHGGVPSAKDGDFWIV